MATKTRPAKSPRAKPAKPPTADNKPPTADDRYRVAVDWLYELTRTSEQLADGMSESFRTAKVAQLSAANREAVVAVQKAMRSVQASLREVHHLLPKMTALSNVPKPYADDVADALRREIRNRLVHLSETGAAIERLGDPNEVAELWVSMLPIEPSPLAELTGPFYDTSGVRKWLGITRQALDSRAKNGTILALVTNSGQRVYPAWQWRANRQAIPHLAEVLQPLLGGARDPWTVALWMSAPVDHGDGREIAAWQWLDEDGDPQAILAEAHADAARWAS
jgi:hypothetical protein